MPEEQFEDVGLSDEQQQQQQQQPPPPAPQKKKGFFAKLAGDATPTPTSTTPSHQPEQQTAGVTGMSRFLPLPGRKRAQSGSGQGAELGVMPVPNMDRPAAVAPPAVALQPQKVEA
jgi:hypothetical protein